MQEEKQDAAAIGDDEEEEDEGPPPGFQCIINPQPPQAGKVEAQVDEDDDEGPPPGFDAVVQKPASSPSLPDLLKSSQEGDDDGEYGPPPGWEFHNLVDALPKPPSKEADVKLESDEDLDEGPPPGWEKVLPYQTPPQSIVPMQTPSAVSSVSVDVEMGSNQAIQGIDNEVPPSVSQLTPVQGHSSPAALPVQKSPSSELHHSANAGMKEDKKAGDKKPVLVPQPASSPKQLPPTPHPAATNSAKSSSEKAQLVCGTCQKLCVYPRGAKWVQCPECQEINFVLEAHEVGQVKCNGCMVLVMYPHGAPAVQCTSCHTVTEIGAHNRRPPLSAQIQQAQRRRRSSRWA